MRLNDETALQWMIDSFDIDLDASRSLCATASPSASRTSRSAATKPGSAASASSRRSAAGNRRVADGRAPRRGAPVRHRSDLARGDRAERGRVPPLREARLRGHALASRSGRFRRGHETAKAREVPAARGARAHPRARARGASPGSVRTDARTLRPASAGSRGTRVPPSSLTGSVQLVQIAGAERTSLLRTVRSARRHVVALNLRRTMPRRPPFRELGGGSVSASARWSSALSAG